MKSATKSFGIIWGILSLIVFVILIIVATTLSANKDASAQSLIDTMGYTYEQALASVEKTIASVFVMGALSMVTAIYSFILSGFVRSSKLKKIPGIILGAFGIVLGALIPGILFIIDSVQSRDQNGLIQEPAEEEKKEETK